MKNSTIIKISLPIILVVIITLISFKINKNQSDNNRDSKTQQISKIEANNSNKATKSRTEIVLGQKDEIQEENNMDAVEEKEPFPSDQQFDEYGQQIYEVEQAKYVKIIKELYFSEFVKGQSSGNKNVFSIESKIILAIELMDNNQEGTMIIKTVNRANNQLVQEMTVDLLSGDIGLINPKQGGQYDVEIKVSEQETYQLSFVIQ
ncbi:MAG: hypothetical protein V1853_00660 [bacterium]